jgi:hypothetical protein
MAAVFGVAVKKHLMDSRASIQIGIPTPFPPDPMDIFRANVSHFSTHSQCRILPRNVVKLVWLD